MGNTVHKTLPGTAGAEGRAGGWPRVGCDPGQEPRVGGGDAASAAGGVPAASLPPR